MFRPVPTRPDLVAIEHEVLDLWRERGTFARLRAQNAGGPRWSFLDGPITANNPMGVHHAWGRTYKDLFQRYHAMLGEDQRYQNGFDCQGLWVEVNVERDLGFKSKRDIEAYGIAEFVTALQAARPDVRRAPDRAVTAARVLDGLERPGRAPPPVRGARRGALEGDDDPGHRGAGDRHRRDARRAPGHARDRRQLLHVQQREQRPHLGLPGRVPQARLDLQGPRLDALVPALRDGHQPARDDRGLPGPRGPGPDRPIPARRPARRGAPRLDDDALDARRERRGGGRAGARVRPRSPGRGAPVGREGDPQAGSGRGVRGAREKRGKRARRLAVQGPVRRACPPSARRSRRARAPHPTRRTSIA